MALNVYFAIGTDPDQATINVNNRVQAAQQACRTKKAVSDYGSAHGSLEVSNAFSESTAAESQIDYRHFFTT